MRTGWILYVFGAFSVMPALAQQGSLGLPVTGYVYNSTGRSVRPIIGVRGSSHLGAAVLNNVDAGSVAPAGKWAFVSQDGQSAFIRTLSDTMSSDGIIEAVDRIVWSPDASFAALYSSASGRLQRVRLASGQVSPEEPVDLTAWGTPSALAIDASGRIVFGAPGSGIGLIDGNQSPIRLLSMERPAAVSFGNSGRIYAVDATAGAITEFGPDLSPSEFAVLEASDGTAPDPVGLAVSKTGGRLLVADRGLRVVRIFDIATRTLAGTIPLDLPPAGFERLTNGAIFLLNRPQEKEWLLILDASEDPAVYFVPAGEEESR